nr:MAG TPA: hypothetical protein [Caudoviricetes sp.]
MVAPRALYALYYSCRQRTATTTRYRLEPAMISYRFQDMNRDLDRLLDPQQQYSYPWDLSLEDTDAVRHGISACASLSDLAAYVATTALQAQVPGVCILEGPESEDEPLDGDTGEILVLPTSAHWLDAELEEKFFRAVDALFDLYWLEGWTWDQLREWARKLLPC